MWKLSKIITFCGYAALLYVIVHFLRSILKVNNDFLRDSFDFREGMTLSTREKDVYVELSETIENNLEKYSEEKIKPLTDFVTSLPEDFKGSLLDLMDEEDKIDVNSAIKRLAIKAKSDDKSAIKNILKELDNIKDDNAVVYDGMRTVLTGG